MLPAMSWQEDDPSSASTPLPPPRPPAGGLPAAVAAALGKPLPPEPLPDPGTALENGIALTRDLRQHMTTPILLLTAKGETVNRIEGLEAGADDYLVKPFEPKELLLRINAILRRVPMNKPAETGPKVLHLGTVRYDMERGELWRGTEPVRLTATEAQLMRIFAAAPGHPIPRGRLVGDLEREVGGGDRAVDVQITRLRRKIEDDPKRPRFLQTVRGEGYMLQPG